MDERKNDNALTVIEDRIRNTCSSLAPSSFFLLFFSLLFSNSRNVGLDTGQWTKGRIIML